MPKLSSEEYRDRGRRPRQGLPAALAPLVARQTSGVPCPNRGKTFPVEVLTTSEALALIYACVHPIHSKPGVRNQALISTLYRSGLRIAEALALYRKDLDLERGAISVLRGKGGRRRTVGIDPGTRAFLEQWIALREELGFKAWEPLFCTLGGANPGRQVSTSYVRDLLPRLAVKAGISKRVHPHGLRHTHAYELMNEGVPLGIIQKQLGHNHLVTTARYLDHFAPEQVLRVMNARTWGAEA